MKWYRVSYTCPICGQVHPVTNMRRIPGGPDQAGTVAELYPGGDLPESLALLMRDSLRCDAGGELVKLSDPERLRLEPWGAADPGN